MSQTVSGWKKNSGILRELVTRDFKLKYRRSMLGVLWSVLNPLLQMIVISAVFSHIFRFSIENYPLYLILGQILFAFMANSVTTGLGSIVDSASLIKKIRIEKMLFPVEKVLSELVNFAFSLVAVVCVMLFYQVIPTWRIVLLPVLLVYSIIFNIGLALILSALVVFFRDIIHLWGVFSLLWMYGTPIFYSLPDVSPVIGQIMGFNPMYHFVNYFRDIAMYGTTPSLAENALCLGGSLGVLLVGVLVFRATQSKFILYV